LNVCQKLSNDSAPVSKTTRDRAVKVFIVVQSAANTKTKGAFWRCSIGSWLL
jgi:hypothetical protein